MSQPLLDLKKSITHSKAYRSNLTCRHILLAAVVVACSAFLLIPALLTLLRTDEVVDVATIRSSHQVCTLVATNRVAKSTIVPSLQQWNVTISA